MTIVIDLITAQTRFNVAMQAQVGEFLCILDSFRVDHTRMDAPARSYSKIYVHTKAVDDITVFDLRFCVPNEEFLSERGIHTLEHIFAWFYANHLNVNGGRNHRHFPMGCRTGFLHGLIRHSF